MIINTLPNEEHTKLREIIPMSTSRIQTYLDRIEQDFSNSEVLAYKYSSTSGCQSFSIPTLERQHLKELKQLQGPDPVQRPRGSNSSKSDYSEVQSQVQSQAVQEGPVPDPR